MARTRAPDQKRAQLKAAALELFKTRGFDDTTTAQITQQAGVSEGILFHQFGSKLNLFKALAADYTEAVVARLIPEGFPPFIQEYVMRTLFDIAEEDRASYALFAEVGSKLDSFSTTHREVLVRHVAEYLSERMRQGAIREGDVNIMASLQVAIVLGTYQAWRVNGDPARKEAFIQEGVRSMTAVLAPDP